LDPSRIDLLRQLQQRIGSLETEKRSAVQASVFPSGYDALDRLLPGRGFTPGTLVEWLSAGDGAGCATLAFKIAARRQRDGGAVVIIDLPRTFHPLAAALLGLDLEKTVLVHPPDRRAQLWAWEQSLRSPAVAVVVGELPQVHERDLRRLQLAAEAGGGAGFLIRPEICRHSASWAEHRLLVRPLPWRRMDVEAGWRLQVELLRSRGKFTGGVAVLELDDEANDVRMASELADPATPVPPAATG
jgi:protein ImuA